MTTITFRLGLPFTTVIITHVGKSLLMDRVLIDTGSAATVFSADRLAEIDLLPEPTDRVREIRGVGGFEYVVEKQTEQITVGTLT